MPTGEEIFFEADEVLIAIGQDNAFPWVERNLGIEFGKWDMPQVDESTFQSTNPKVFFGGDAAFRSQKTSSLRSRMVIRPRSPLTFSLGQVCSTAPGTRGQSHQPKNGCSRVELRQSGHIDLRQKVPHVDKVVALKDRKVEVELGFDIDTAYREAERCLNCDVQTVFDGAKCIECDGCTDICPTDCINFIDNSEEPVMRRSLRAPANIETQDLYVSERWCKPTA